MAFSLLVLVLSGFALALFAPAIHWVTRGATGWIVAILPAGLTAWFLTQADVIASSGAIREMTPWVPAMGLSLSFLLDGLSLLMCLLITGIGTLVFLYAGGYLAGHPQLGRLYALLLLFMASMLGLVLADNLLCLFVFWELTSISSYLLIGFDHERAESRSAALQALLVTGGGGLALLAGLLLLGEAAGTMEISALAGVGDGLRANPLVVPAVVLVLVGAFTKSAQFPFHFWLPGAMAAPTPISAYLHSATMVKAGVYLVARLTPALAGTDVWFWSTTLVGGATMLLGAWLALLQSDLKRVLAYSTVSALGTLMLLLGLGGAEAIPAAMAFLLGHALYKGALFLVAGTLDHETGTRDADRLGGLFLKLPVTALAALVAALSMAGLPPLIGFLSKELTYEASLHAPASTAATAAAVAANALMVAVAIVAGIGPFIGRRQETPKTPHEAPLSMWLGSLTLATLSVVLGAWPALATDRLISQASAAVLNAPVDLHFKLWHGINPALVLSAITLGLGLVTYAVRPWLRRAAARCNWLAAWGPSAWYGQALQGLVGLARLQTRLLQSGYLRYYLIITLGTTVVLACAALFRGGRPPVGFDWSGLHFYDAGLALIILLATSATLVARTRLAAIATLGVVGYCVALLFVVFGAPDVAMTQFLVETLTVILFVLVFYHLPDPLAPSRPAIRVRDALIAVSVGGLMTTFVLLATRLQTDPSISKYYASHSVKEAHGRNIVNVILVDFRGLDTLGEITVLAAAGIGVYALLRLRPREAAQERPPAGAGPDTGGAE